MLTDTTTRSWLAKRPAVQRMPHCYLLGTADAALDIWFEKHALAKCAAQRQDAKGTYFIKSTMRLAPPN